MGEKAGLPEGEVLARLKRLKENRVVRQVSAAVSELLSPSSQSSPVSITLSPQLAGWQA